MSRVCDFCGENEDKVEKMCEGGDRSLNRHGCYEHPVHICLECAKVAVEAMTKAKEKT